ncbi:hypothetical protein [Spiroplasma endosymbiont of Virgichneumon dumeticola]|uniref:hypothetical protein n=1 Tax=Spiroplasma endosymbiont of Virgichneumon dumeticola TaxID=3139323 RepID=UPI0035C8D917
MSTSLTPIITNTINNKTTTNTNLYVLGDSLSDTGALAGAGTQFFKQAVYYFPTFKEVKLEPRFTIVHFQMVALLCKL